MSQELTVLDPRIAQFSNLIKQGIDAWQHAGKILCDLVAEDPNAGAAIMAENPYMTPEILDNFLRIGRREVYTHLLLDSSPGAKRLAALPYDQQVQLHRAELSVAVWSGGVAVTRTKRLSELTKAEADRALSDTGPRPVAEQMRMLRRPITRGEGGAGPGRFHREFTPDAEADPAPESPEPESLDESPKAVLLRRLSNAQRELLEARNALTMLVQRESRQDRHITAALNAIGLLRLATNEDEL